jgi:hypothetical protein
VNEMGCPWGFVSIIVGEPYVTFNVAGTPKHFNIAYEACVLKLARFPPKVYVISLGIGTMKIRSATGMMIAFKAFRLKRTRIMPDTNTGRESR